jgi:hypothetical protein
LSNTSSSTLTVFARPTDFPDELKGGHSFALLKVSLEEAVPPEES